jgi:hypothetical protein
MARDTRAASEIRRAADFRAALREFLARSDKLLRGYGLTNRQYVLLLMVAAARTDADATIGAIAARLQLAENTVTELATRAQERGLLGPGQGPGRPPRRPTPAHARGRAAPDSGGPGTPRRAPPTRESSSPLNALNRPGSEKFGVEHVRDPVPPSPGDALCG